MSRTPFYMMASNFAQAIGGHIFQDNKDASKYYCRSPGLVWLATQHHFHRRLCFHRDLCPFEQNIAW